MPRFRDGAGSTGRVNVRIHPVAKARMMAYCESRTRETGAAYSLSMLVNDLGWCLPPVAPEIERKLRIRRADNEEQTAQSAKPPRPDPPVLP
jgi:hypothetical protein